MPRLKFSKGLTDEKLKYRSPQNYYYQVVKPWIESVGVDHPQARGASQNALWLGGKINSEWGQFEMLINELNSFIEVPRRLSSLGNTKSVHDRGCVR